MRVLEILLVDDHAPTRRRTEARLTELGHQVTCVDSGLNALQRLATHPTVEVLVVDWIMPGMDGLELCRLARELQGGQQRKHRLYILFLTQRDGSEDLVAALEAGADAFLIKSADPAELKAHLSVVQRTLELEDRIQAQLAELQRQNEELTSARRHAEQANAAKGDFLANMSHEIRTPMQGVLGTVGLVMGTALSPEQRDLMEMVQVSAESLLTILDSVLDYSKIEAGKLELHRESFNCGELVASSLSPFLATAQSRGVELVCRVDRHVPARVRGASGQLRQVLLNLVSNAVKFTTSGHVLVSVDEAGPDSLRFSVEDTGSGIPADKLQSVFESFTQAEASISRTHGGTGLGLTISRSLIALMGGKLEVTSQVGEGTRFTFTLPLPGEEPAPQPLAGLPPAFVMAVGPAETRLLVELLQQRGHETHQPQNAAELEAAARLGSRVFVDSARSDTAQLLALCNQEGMTAVVLSSAQPLPSGARVLRRPVTRFALDRLLENNEHVPVAVALTPLSVLLAEDNPMNRKVMSMLLSREGHRVEQAETGRAAVELWKQHTFDLILMDLQMPEMNGLEATAQIRAGERASGVARTPIVALTARALEADRQRCLDAEMDAYLTKPLFMPALWALCRQLLPAKVPT